jgi:transcriptional regulator of arginine metabolism
MGTTRLSVQERRRLIDSLLRDHVVSSQDVLSAALARRGASVTQSTLSRDLKALGVARVATAGGYRYLPRDLADAARAGQTSPTVGAQTSRLREIATLGVRAIGHNETTVVVHTLDGHANSVGTFVDRLGWPDLLATIAGNDTLLVLPRSTEGTARLARRLAERLGVELR